MFSVIVQRGVVHILTPSLVMVQASQVQSESAAEEEAITKRVCVYGGTLSDGVRL